jgi:DNA-binding transcriptional LysR family regulator
LCRRDSNVILDELLHNRLDLAIVADPRADRRMRHETLIEDPISLVCGIRGREGCRPKSIPFHPTAEILS